MTYVFAYDHSNSELMDLTQSICRSANRIYLAVHFSIGSRCPDATHRTILEAANAAQNLLFRVDPFWLRTSYESILDDDSISVSSGNVSQLFESTVGDLMQKINVHQRPIARLGSVLCSWDAVVVPFSQLADSLDALQLAMQNEKQLIYDLLHDREASNTKLLAFSDVFYGLVVLIAAINSPPHTLNGFRTAIALAGAKVAVDSSKQLPYQIAN